MVDDAAPIRCAGCGAGELAPAPGDPDALVCAYCGSRLRRPGAPGRVRDPAPLAPAPLAPGAVPAVACAVAALVLVLGLVGLGGLGLAVHTERRAAELEALRAAEERARAEELRAMRRAAERPEVGPAAESPDATGRARGEGEAPGAVADLVAPPPARAPKPARATGAFELHGQAAAVGSSFYLLGMVENTSPFAVGKPRIDVVLLDEAGAEVGVHQGYAEEDDLDPGARSPTLILVHEPRPHASFRCELRLEAATYRAPRADGLVVTPLPPEERRGGRWRFAGSARNDGAHLARFVKVRVVALDEAGQVVGLTRTYAAGKDGLEPGGTARYEVELGVLARRPARFEVTVSGRR